MGLGLIVYEIPIAAGGQHLRYAESLASLRTTASLTSRALHTSEDQASWPTLNGL